MTAGIRQPAEGHRCGAGPRAEADLHLAEQDASRTASLVNTRVPFPARRTMAASQRRDCPRAALLAAKAARDSAHLDLEYTSVRAPIDGKVSRALLTVGNYVNGPATMLTTLASTGPMHVYADLDETSYLRLQQHYPKSIPLPSGWNCAFQMIQAPRCGARSSPSITDSMRRADPS